MQKKKATHNVIDMAGKTINGVKIVSRAENRESRKRLAAWNCICPCGRKFISVGADIRLGRVKTCGCRITIKSKRNWQGTKDIPKTTFSSFVRNAENRNIKFDLTIQQIQELFDLQKKKCSLSGRSIIFSADRNKNTASLDRINSKGIYEITNVQIVHKHVNFMKQGYDQEYFIQLCHEISNNCLIKN